MDVETAIEVLTESKECAVRAGIYNSWAICFGTVLGRIRDYFKNNLKNPFIPYDHDMDIVIKSWEITKDQEIDYVNQLKEKGLFKNRNRHSYRYDTNRHVWHSLRKRKDGTKCCTWYMFNHKGYTWHTKGGLWVNENKFSIKNYNYKKDYSAICKGAPQQYFKYFTEVDFGIGKFNVPLMSGHLCDFWYPDWHFPIKNGTSAKKVILLIPKWTEPEAWKMV